MIDPLQASSRLAGAGLEAQSMRLRIVSENIANAQSTGKTAGSDPYTRKTVTFRSELDRALGASSVQVKEVGVDRAPFQVEYDPGNPAADENGNVKLPNVNMLIEMADMREANRSYEANLQMMKQTRSMISGLIDLLRGT
jgi:flagellar basal-body rod protein FlgC